MLRTISIKNEKSKKTAKFGNTDIRLVRSRQTHPGKKERTASSLWVIAF
jgi:hypothetical protein